MLSFFGSFILGGETILILSVIAGQGIFKFWIIWLFCMIGMFCADLTWFMFGKIKFLSKLKKIKFMYRGYKKAEEEIESAPSELFLMILIKFAYGIGIPLLIYLGRKGKMSIKNFILRNSIIIFIWTTVIVIIGWILGKTSAIATDKLESIYAGIGLIITGLIIINFIGRAVARYLIKIERRRIRRKKKR